MMGDQRDSDDLAVAFHRGNKYRNSAKTLLPYRRKKTTGHPADNAGFFSTVLFSWLTSLVWKLYRRPVPVESLWQAPENDKGQTNCERFVRIWNEEVKSRGADASMKRVFMRFLRTRLLVSVLCIFLFVVFQFVSNGLLVRYLLKYVEESNADLKIGLLIVGSMFVVELLRMICFSMSFAVSIRTGIRLRSGVTMAVFQKILRVPPTESSSIGEIVNLCSSDGDRLFEAAYLGGMLFTGPIMFIAGTSYLCTLVGPIALTGCGLFFVIFLLQVGLLRLLNLLRQRAIAFTDKRVKAINEVISSIKLIKMYAWEESFTKLIEQVRNQEQNVLLRALFVQSLNMSIASLSPYAATIVTIIFSVLLGHNITSSEAFTCFSMFNVMSFSLKVIPIALKHVAEAGVAADRVQKIMERKEFVDYLQNETSSPNLAIEMQKATLFWPSDESHDDDSKKEHEKVDESAQEKRVLTRNGDSSSISTYCLVDINFEVSTGSLVGICGRVGCGKSSLIVGMLGHLELNDGTVAVNGSTAYCAQQAWIMNATIRDNITFGLPYDSDKYNKIVEACCLLPDFEILPSGDLTEVGERGVNMSGGQKQRINIARAIYMDKDIYLLDDPLSAVDAHVGKALFENAIMALLKNSGKTVVLVTHRLEYLPYCDKVILMKRGRVWEIGSHDDLMYNAEDYYQLYRMWSREKEEGDLDKEDAPKTIKKEFQNDLDQNKESRIELGRLMTTEEKQEGSISSETYSMYIEAAGGWFISVLCLLIFVVFVCCLQFNTFWLSYWLTQGSGQVNVTREDVFNVTDTPVDFNAANSSLDTNFSTSVELEFSNVSETDTMASQNRILDNPRLYFYMSVFGYAVVATVVTMILKAYVFMALSLKASHRLHNKLFDKILHGTMEFFDTTPTGRILNRFQKDQDTLDTIFPLLMDLVITFGIFVLSCVAFVAFVFPYFLVTLLVLVPIFLAAFFIFKGAVREMRRQDNITRSPWLSHITTTISGIHTIRAYKRVKDFIEGFCERLDTNTVPFFLYGSVNRWLVIRLDFMTITVVSICALLVVLTNGAISAALAGLAITSTLMMTTVFQFTVRTSVEAEANFVCAERIIHYINTVPQEPRVNRKKDVDKRWPEFGSVRFVDVQMRYRNGLPLVLKGISFTINTCEKIGVVGRTGSGKSSLGVALFRLVELVGGRIEIDGIDIKELSLSQLRSKIAIIPQEPVLFSGTVKYNVDPFGQYTEEEIWQALERTHLKEPISSLPMKLQAPVSENGGNFSVGERQLLCLTRALLRHNKILLLDEATASIDARTDKLVQDTINEHFADCTLITIAHRLHTVRTCDKIMVLDHGSLKEFDTPDNLSSNPESLFSKLLTSTKV